MTTDPDVLIDQVRRATETDRDQARVILTAVATTLGQRLTFEQTRHLAATLPPEIGQDLTEGDAAQRFDRDAFIDRIAALTDTDPATAERYTQAGLGAIGTATSADQLAKVRDQLPDDLAQMLGRLPDRQRPRPIDKGTAFSERSSTKEVPQSGRDEIPRYGRQGSN